MSKKLHTFLDSGLLESYLIGNTTFEETKTVEAYIGQHTEVAEVYNRMQNNLEIVAKSNAVEAPAHVLCGVLNELDDAPVVKMNTTKKPWFKYSIAASVAALLFAGSSFFFYQQNQGLKEENQVVVDEIFDLRSDIDKQNERLGDILNQFKQLNNPETEKYIMTNRDKNLKTVAYINPKEKTSMIDVVSLPPLPEDKQYQIWAQVQDKMVNLGIINETDRQLKSIPYTEDAMGLNITVEPKGVTTETASAENTVAKIDLKESADKED